MTCSSTPTHAVRSAWPLAMLSTKTLCGAGLLEKLVVIHLFSKPLNFFVEKLKLQ